MTFNCPKCEMEYDTADFMEEMGEFRCDCGGWVTVPDCEPDYDAQAKDDRVDLE